VLDRGVIAQIGAPLELYSRPDNKFVASFIGSPTMNFLGVTPQGIDGRDITLAFHRAGMTSPGTLRVAARNALDGAGAEPAEIGIRPEHISIIDPSDQRAQLDGVVQLVERLGNLTIAYISTQVGQIVVQGSGELAIRVDDTVGLVFDASRTHMFDRDGRIV
jgi:ABC-type sugar transport system ATPase subunit